MSTKNTDPKEVRDEFLSALSAPHEPFSPRIVISERYAPESCRTEFVVYSKDGESEPRYDIINFIQPLGYSNTVISTNALLLTFRTAFNRLLALIAKYPHHEAIYVYRHASQIFEEFQTTCQQEIQKIQKDE